MAAGTTHVYANVLAKAFNKEIDWNSDTIKCQLHTSSYTPNYDTHAYQSSLTNEISGTGYTTGGKTLTSCAITLQASSALTAWQASTAYVVGNVRRKTTDNGHAYICVVAGTSAGTEPTWPTTPGATVTDGTVTWAEAGQDVLKLTGSIPTWTSGTFTARYGVILDTTPGSSATNPLIACIDFGSDQSPSAGDFTITLDNDGAIVIPVRA